MKEFDLKIRTKNFAVNVLNMVQKIPSTIIGATISKQIIRSSTSIAANYRAVCRAKSDKDFLNKIIIVEEEADETLFWLELIHEMKLANDAIILPLKNECNELTAIFTASGKTVRNKIKKNSTN